MYMYAYIHIYIHVQVIYIEHLYSKVATNFADWDRA